MENKSFLAVLKKSTLSFYYVSPMILGVLGISALLITFVSPTEAHKIFTGNKTLDTIYGAVLGSIMMGNALLSYILAGEFQNMNISLFAITAFLLSWVSIGYVQIPMEISFFGKRFTFVRNGLAIVFTLIISVLIVVTYEKVR